MIGIYEQLDKYCDCLQKDFKDNEKDQILKYIEEMINYVSLITCWTQVPCETFLMSLRSETFIPRDIERCGCNSGITNLPLFYDNVQKDGMKVTIVTREGIHERINELPSDKFNYSEVENLLYLDLNDYVFNDECTCENLVKITVEYFAGYEQLPNCLLPLFCDLLKIVIDKNDCSCDNCQTCKQGESNEEAAEGEVKIFGDPGIAVSIEKYATNLIRSGYKMQLDLISLCHKRRRFIGMIV